jgi:hypothetical protein
VYLGSLQDNVLYRPIGLAPRKSVTGRGLMKRPPALAKIIAVLSRTSHVTNQPTDSRSPYHSYKPCLLTNRRAGSPAVALDKSRLVQASSSSKLSDVGNAARHIYADRALTPESPKAGRRGSTTCPGYPQRRPHVDKLNRAQLTLFDYPDRGAFSRFFPQL